MLEEIASNLSIQRHSLIIHSTAKFTPEDISEIREFGDPAWLIEATNFHDTYAKDGREAFPPVEWGGEIDVICIEGMPKVQEHVVYHRPSKTLIVADLLFNIAPDAGWWTHSFLRATAGIQIYPGMSRLFRHFIKNRTAFAQSMQIIAALDFDRIVVAHGNPIVDNAKSTFLELLAKHGLVNGG